MDKEKAAADIIASALPHVAFDGWSDAALKRAAKEADYQEFDVIRVFPGGAIEAVERFIALADTRMEQAMHEQPVAAMKVRQRIATAVRLRIEAYGGQREAVRKAISTLALPWNAHRGAARLYRTVDAIWRAAGDASTDFNFYTKRLTLAGVYSATLLCWLNDKSPGSAETWAFLDRRIEDVMKIEKAKSRLREWTEMMDPYSLGVRRSKRVP